MSRIVGVLLNREMLYSRCEALIGNEETNAALLGHGVGVAGVLPRVAFAYLVIVAYVGPSFFLQHGVEGRQGLRRCIEISAYELRAFLHVEELHPDDRQDIIGPLRFSAPFGSARPSVDDGTRHCVPTDVNAEDLASARFFGI